MVVTVPKISGVGWSEAERAAWAPLERMRPSEWAELRRILTRAQSAHPGPWRNELAPYLVGIMDLCIVPGVERLDVEKASQIGVSEALRNVLGFWAETEPDPVGLTLPNRQKGRQIVADRIIPMLRSTPALRVFLSPRLHDTKKEQVKLINGWTLFLMWSGSPAAMASDPMRRVVNDEVDKHEDHAGGEASSIRLTWRRLETYEDRKLQVNISTPTTRYGRIAVLLDSDRVQLRYLVPCPYCGAYQELLFPRLRWKKPKGEYSKRELAAALLRSGEVWYECEGCGKRIREKQRPAMVRAGRWGSPDGSLEGADGKRYRDALDVPRWPRGTRIGMQISALYCLWRRWAAIAAEFVEAAGNYDATFDFRVNTLGEPFEQQIERAAAPVFAGKSKGAGLKEAIVPRWAWKILAAVDVQADHFFVVIRAWGFEMRSARVWHGRVETFEQLDEICFARPWAVEGDAGPAMRPELVAIDTGGTKQAEAVASRTMEVYRWALPRRQRVRPIKGASRPRPDARIWPGRGWLQLSAGEGSKKRRGREVRIWFVDTAHFQDELSSLIIAGLEEGDDREEMWHLNTRNDPEYNEHLANMRKVVLPEKGVMRERWIPAQTGARVDYRDCEVYQVALAYMAGVHQLPDAKVLDEFRQQQAKAGARDDQGRSSSKWTVKSLKEFL